MDSLDWAPPTGVGGAVSKTQKPLPTRQPIQPRQKETQRRGQPGQLLPTIADRTVIPRSTRRRVVQIRRRFGEEP